MLPVQLHGISDFEELFNRQLGADGGAANHQADVVQTAEGRGLVLAERIHHFRGQGQLGADGVGVGGRLQAAGQLLAERAGGVAGQQLAHLAEFEQFQGV